MSTEMHKSPDIIAEVTMFTEADTTMLPEGVARTRKIPPIILMCPMRIEGAFFDCCIPLQELDFGMAPGETVRVPILFLSPEKVRPLIHLGSRFFLWTGGLFARGTILEIFPPREKRVQ